MIMIGISRLTPGTKEIAYARAEQVPGAPRAIHPGEKA